MSDSNISSSTDAGAAKSPPAGDAQRTPHDRELPVTAEVERGPMHRAQPVEPDVPAAEAPNAAPAEGEPLTEDQVKLALRRVKDPELNLNILDLGLVYDIKVEGNDVSIDMTLTSPGCPSGPEIMTDAERHLKALPGVGSVAVNLVWSPFWSPDRIEPRVRAYLGF
jgi:metal-sulfur cluster biosynthetic enzyme